MPQKCNIAPEEKVRVVEKYLARQLGLSDFKRIYGLQDSRLYEWIRTYKAKGAGGFVPSGTCRKYSADVKYSAVRDYLSGAGTQDDICVKYDIGGRKVLQRWIQCYNGHGDFKDPKSGGAIDMVKGRKTTLEERIELVSHCIANNKDYGKTAEQYGISYQQIYSWVRKYEKEGAEGLADYRGKRKDEASMTEVEKLRAQLKLKEAENLRLQMENELLKKLEALERGIDGD